MPINNAGTGPKTENLSVIRNAVHFICCGMCDVLLCIHMSISCCDIVSHSIFFYCPFCPASKEVQVEFSSGHSINSHGEFSKGCFESRTAEVFFEILIFFGA